MQQSLFPLMLIVVAPFVLSEPTEPPTLAPSSAGAIQWNKLNSKPVCYEGKGDKPGVMTYYGEDRMVGAIKLVHLHGFVRCEFSPAFDSIWGCYQIKEFKHFPFNVIITDGKNHVLFPKEALFRNTGLWYAMPFMDEKLSKHLVFSDMAQPLYLPKFGEIRVWYGEDLKNWNEIDNHGKVCVDVYGRFV